MIPINEDIQQRIKITPCTNRSSACISEMASYLQTFDMFEIQLSEKVTQINDIIQSAIKFYPPRNVRAKYTPNVCFIINKYLNIFMKYQSLRFSRCQQVTIAIKEIKKVIISYLTKNIAVEFDFWDYVAFIFSKTDKYLHKLEFKLKSMYNYIQNLQSIVKVPNYSDLDMLKEMRELISDVDSFNGFIHQNNFDLMFECYVESNSEIQSYFDRVIHFYPKQNNLASGVIDLLKPEENNTVNNRSLSHLILNNFDFFIERVEQKAAHIKNNKSKANSEFNCYNDKDSNCNKQSKFDLKLFDKLVNLVYIKITPSEYRNQKMFTILRCAAFRYLCNRYYIFQSNEWLQKPSQTYFDNINKIIKETPRELLISIDIIPSNYYDIKFENLLAYEDFLKATDHIFLIQFYTCPIDIWKEVYFSIVSSVNAANKFANANSTQSIIAFDDFFSILLPVFSSAQLTCPNALNSLLSCFTCVKKQNSLEIASTTILALLKIVEIKM